MDTSTYSYDVFEICAMNGDGRWEMESFRARPKLWFLILYFIKTLLHYSIMF